MRKCHICGASEDLVYIEKGKLITKGYLIPITKGHVCRPCSLKRRIIINKKKLNLGSGNDYKNGWTNVDLHGKYDVKHDLNRLPFPFKDDQFDYVLASHVIEHLNDTVKVMTELNRITKQGGIIEIKVPYFNSFNSFRDVTHKQFFTWDSFSPFTGFVSSKEGNVDYIPKLFGYKERKVIWGTSKRFTFACNLVNRLVNLNPEFMERRFPFLVTVEALHIKLENIKGNGK
jgi:SAM-dependent methyltransferase